jgi:hypothetical protein
MMTHPTFQPRLGAPVPDQIPHSSTMPEIGVSTPPVGACAYFKAKGEASLTFPGSRESRDDDDNTKNHVEEVGWASAALAAESVPREVAEPMDVDAEEDLTDHEEEQSQADFLRHRNGVSDRASEYLI